MTIEKIDYKGWPNSYRLSNGEVDLIATSDVGPRILHYSFKGGQNLMHVVEAMAGKSGEPTWQSRGGHRLWVGPEAVPLTYGLDNGPVVASIENGRTIVLDQPVEPLTGVSKQIGITMSDTGSDVELVHRIYNHTLFTLEFAAWALTVMAPGGVAITGFPPRGTHPDALLPSNPLVMWPYTDFSDPRWKFTKKYLILRQDPAAVTPQKAGLFNADTWCAYLLGEDLFMKKYAASAAAVHPDMGCSFEFFTNSDMLELETMGPLTRVQPGGYLEHTERWSLRGGVNIEQWNDPELDSLFGDG